MIKSSFLLSVLSITLISLTLTSQPSFADGGYERPEKEPEFMGNKVCEQCDEDNKNLIHEVTMVNIYKVYTDTDKETDEKTEEKTIDEGFKKALSKYLNEINVCGTSPSYRGYSHCDRWGAKMNVKVYSKNAKELRAGQEITLQISAVQDPTKMKNGKPKTLTAPRLAFQLNGTIMPVIDGEVAHVFQPNHEVNYKGNAVGTNIRFVIPDGKNSPILIMNLDSYFDIGGFLVLPTSI